MKKSLLIAAVASMLIGADVQAAEPGLGSAKPGSYKVESYHTQVGFSISHLAHELFRPIFRSDGQSAARSSQAWYVEGSISDSR